MNPRTKDFLFEILQTEDAWDKKTRELKYRAVLDMLLTLREARFYDQVYFRLMFRAVHLAHLFHVFPEDAYQKILLDGQEVTWFGEEWVTSWFVDPGSYIHSLWEGEWGYEEPGRDEILALGVRPNLVPAKKVKGNVVQESLF